MRRAIALVVVVALLTPVAVLAVGNRAAQYVGGTLTAVREKAEGPFSTASEAQLVFTPSKRHGGGTLEIRYEAITGLEYGQDVSRRVAAAILVSPLALFAKKRKHYLTISFTDEAGSDQVAVFELGKDIVRATLRILETRSGRAIVYQDEDARKSGVGGQ